MGTAAKLPTRQSHHGPVLCHPESPDHGDARCAACAPELRDGSIIFPRAYPRTLLPRAYPRTLLSRAYPRDEAREQVGRGRWSARAGANLFLPHGVMRRTRDPIFRAHDAVWRARDLSGAGDSGVRGSVLRNPTYPT